MEDNCGVEGGIGAKEYPVLFLHNGKSINDALN